ncbi:hypothetical protein [Flavobacterium sp. UBA6135]|uniref:hypothetical protein n=1 Tax=Flavobacterium sp. UBA6135 TaxID=1946553 RepID=UPI0025C198C0|nr:hypothetical protein [Flavobacterium sp. UBA6135]
MGNNIWKLVNNSKFLLLIIVFFSTNVEAQEPKVDFAFYDGIVIMGYVDQGGFLNFTGPNVNFSTNNSKFILGMLPSLRFKEDNNTPKNAFVTPNLGVGLTYSYRFLAIQMPIYYNAKTATNDGKWRIGLGLGIRLNSLNKKP